MKVLAFDTTLAACSVALWANGAVRAAGFRLQQQGHAETLFPMIEAVCAQAGVALAGVDALAVTVGPGTFTGVRIGLAAARGLRLALRGPVIPIPTLQAIAATAARGRAEAATLVVHDARRDEVYVQAFDGALQPVTEPAVLPLTQVALAWRDQKMILAGSGAPALALLWGDDTVIAGDPGADGFGQPDARDFAGLAADALMRLGAEAFAEAPMPVYLRAPDAKLPVPRAP
jgi:tRNA threonylcarbamoyladenosine biosynthesis protein TsaB